MWKLACFIENEGGNTMERETILYISDQATSSNLMLLALQDAGYEVVTTNNPTQAIALLFIMHSVSGVVLKERARQLANFDVARSLRVIRPDVPVLLLCLDRIERLPPCLDACPSTGQTVEKLTSALRHL